MIRFLTLSIMIHLCVIGLISKKIVLKETIIKTSLKINFENNKHKRLFGTKHFNKIDLRSEKLKLGKSFLSLNQKELSNDKYFGVKNEYSRDVLFTMPKVLKLFDLLAEKINFHLEYPEMLIENGVVGTSELDLYFNDEGLIDENRSHFSGASRYVRGLLVRAVRNGLKQWYDTDSYRLSKDEFKNQHFTAEFSITHFNINESRLLKTGNSSYKMVRRHYMNECANPGGVDLVCMYFKAKGFAEKRLSLRYKNQLDALKEKLEDFDALGLKEINLILKKS